MARGTPGARPRSTGPDRPASTIGPRRGPPGPPPRKDPTIAPPPDPGPEHDDLDERSGGTPEPVGTELAGTEPVEPTDLDDAAEDARWGIAPEAPITGVGAPPVVAVVVTRDPGVWFDTTLRSLAEQDYASLSVLVVVNAGDEDPTDRVHRVLPDAVVRRRRSDAGFSAAANEVLGAVDGATFHLVLHDDVALPPDAVTALVTEAFRANAGVVGPKLVDWDDPTVLRSVGLAVDAYGASGPLVDPGEIDQSQHDLARPVFAVSSACLLVRADLFEAIGGFSDDVPYVGEDVDLCWRARLAGASVQFCPRVAVRHRGDFGARREIDLDAQGLRHQGRMVLVNDQLGRLVWRVPVAAVLSLVDLLGSILLARFGRVGDVVSAYAWNLGHLPSVPRARRRVRRVRRVGDRELRPLVHRGSFRLRSLVRTEEGESRFAAAGRAGRGRLRDLSPGSSRLALTLVVATVLIALVGARKLLVGELPVLREFVTPGGDLGPLWGEWWTAWRGAGLGEPSVPTSFVPGLAALSTVLFGALDLARRLVILLPLLVGAVGAWKLFLRSGSVRARAAALAVYALNPVALNAMATGRLQALVVYAAAPWFLRRIATRSGVEPFASIDDRPGPLGRHLAGNALLLVVVGSVSPVGAAGLVLVGCLLALAPLLARRRGGAARMVGSAVGGLLLAVPVLVPWLVESLRHGDVASLTGVWVGRMATPSAAEVITGSVGPVTVGYLGWGIVVAAFVPLLTGRSWRLAWAVAGWVLSLVAWTAAVLAAGTGWFAGAGLELYLVAAAVGLVVSVAMGPLAFEHDVVAGDFGAAQVVAGVGAAALVIGLVPVFVASSDGRWYQPQGDFQRALALVDRGEDFRTLWIGDPDVLPLSGWSLGGRGDLAVGVSEGFEPTITQRYRLDGGTGVARLRQAVAAALDGRTARLGQLLAPMGIRYVILVDRPAPEPFAPREVPPPTGAVAALEEQLDLAQVPLAPGAWLFRVAQPWPLRSDATDQGIPPGGARTLGAVLRLPSSAPPPAMGRGPGTSFSGRVADGELVAQAVTADPGWSLTAAGRAAPRRDLFGWSQGFQVQRGGAAELSWSPPVSSRVLQAVQVLGLLLVLVLALRRVGPAPVRRRRRIERPEEPVLVVTAGEGAREPRRWDEPAPPGSEGVR